MYSLIQIFLFSNISNTSNISISYEYYKTKLRYRLYLTRIVLEVRIGLDPIIDDDEVRGVISFTDSDLYKLTRRLIRDRFSNLETVATSPLVDSSSFFLVSPFFFLFFLLIIPVDRSVYYTAVANEPHQVVSSRGQNTVIIHVIEPFTPPTTGKS